jgi:hypothetical protein
MSQYYYTDGTERYGPFSIDQLKFKNITQDTLVWKEGQADWLPARDLSDLKDLFLMSSDPSASMPATMPYSGATPLAPPKNWLIESVLVTILCCLPLGIVGIIHATKVDTLWSTGQQEAAHKASQEAAKWVKIGFFIGIGVIGLYLIFMVFGVLASIGSGVSI